MGHVKTVSVIDSELGDLKAPAEWKPTFRELALMISLGIVSLMMALDATIIVTSISTVVSDLKGTTTEGFWIGTAYLLAAAVCMPFIASISDIFGRLGSLISSLAIFTTGSLVCSLASNMRILIIGRGVQGIGGGGIIICALIIFTDIVPLRHRSKWYGIVQGSWAIGTCIGPVLGGFIVSHTTWRWIFYVMFPFCAIGSVTIPATLRLESRTGSFWSKVKRIDWIGAVLFISSTTSFLVAVSQAGTQVAWSSWRTIIPLSAGVLGMLVTALWEGYGAKHPFLKRSLWHCGSAFMAYFGTVINGFIIYGTMYYIPIYFLAVKGDSPTKVGVDILPAAATLAPTSVIVGVLISRLGAFRWAVTTGWLITTAATGLLYLLDVDTYDLVWIELLILLGIGEGLVLNSTNFATQAIALPGDEGAAAAMYAFMRSFGMALGVGISGTVFQNAMKSSLSDLHMDTRIAANSEAIIEMIKTLKPSEALAIRQAFVSGIRYTNILYCGLSGLALLSSLLISHYSLDRELDSKADRASYVFEVKDAWVEEIKMYRPAPAYAAVGIGRYDPKNVI